MKKTEIIEKLREAYAKLDDAIATVNGLQEELASVKSLIEDLPDETDEIEEDDAKPE